MVFKIYTTAHGRVYLITFYEINIFGLLWMVRDFCFSHRGCDYMVFKIYTTANGRVYLITFYEINIIGLLWMVRDFCPGTLQSPPLIKLITKCIIYCIILFYMIFLTGTSEHNLTSGLWHELAS
jgi:hypothetical protein